MKLSISETAEKMGALAAKEVASLITDCVERQDYCRILVSTGQSQFEYFEALTKLPVPWDKVEIFHLDEYIGIPITHKASFRKYLKERFVDKIGNAKMNYISGEGDTEKTLAEMGARLSERPVDIGIIGIGVNGHIAFNDPPADFEKECPYHVVTLDETCRMQQVGEGWFAGIEDVPKTAISATVKQIMRCKVIVSVVPHSVKADAVKKTLESPEITNLVPATIMRAHPDWRLFIDEDAAAMLNR